MGGQFISNTVTTYKENMTGSLIDSWSCSQSSYSGDWNTCSRIGRRIKVADKFTDSVWKKFINNEEKIDESTSKWESTVWDLGVVGYEVWTAKKMNPEKKGTPQYETKYVLCTYDSLGGERILESSKTATPLNEKAIRLTLDGKNVFVKKTKVLVKGTETTATFKLEKKVYKSKPKSVKAGSIIREMHKYYVSAVASC